MQVQGINPAIENNDEVNYDMLLECELLPFSYSLTKVYENRRHFPYTVNNCYVNATLTLIKAVGVLKFDSEDSFRERMKADKTFKDHSKA